MKTILLLYIPVIHQGYLKLFEKYKQRVDAIFILGDEFIGELMPLHREIRALNPETIQQMIRTLGFFQDIRILDRHLMDSFQSAFPRPRIITVSENISRKFAEKYLPGFEIEFDTVFLRWDEESVLSVRAADYDCQISKNEFDRKIIRKAMEESRQSSDWWRQVGVVLIIDGRVILLAHNSHIPSEHTPYVVGDPRDFIEAGKLSEFSSAIHGEAAIIAEAAKRGIKLDGASLYATVFPCPACAKLIAYSGIKKLFFSSGHASLDGEEVLKSQGVELIFVKMS